MQQTRFDSCRKSRSGRGDLPNVVIVSVEFLRPTDRIELACRVMPKAARVLAALKRDGWTETRRAGSHRVLVKGDRQRVWA
jgi:hypothetical protein